MHEELGNIDQGLTLWADRLGIEPKPATKSLSGYHVGIIALSVVAALIIWLPALMAWNFYPTNIMSFELTISWFGFSWVASGIWAAVATAAWELGK